MRDRGRGLSNYRTPLGRIHSPTTRRQLAFRIRHFAGRLVESQAIDWRSSYSTDDYLGPAFARPLLPSTSGCAWMLVGRGALMTNADIIELAKALAWPVVVGGGLWYFRETIIANLPRVTRVGPVTLDPPPPQNLPVIADSTSNEAIKRVEALVPPELLAEARKLIEASVPRNAQGEKIAEVQYLTTLTATITLVALFEKAYGTIWGSQLQLLQSLNSSPQSVERSKTFYERAAQDSPAAYQHYSFEQWIGFLIESVLITKSNDGQFAITLRGRGFLRFVVDSGYSFARPF